MNKLLVDVGNTTADFRFYNYKTKEIVELLRIYSKEIKDINFIYKNLKDKIDNCDEMLFSSVVVEWNAILFKLSKKLNIKFKNIKKDFKHNKDNFLVDSFESIGEDFIANYYGLIQNNYTNALLISLGTATTFLKVKDSKMEGVIISPGIMSALNALINDASGLNTNDFLVSDLIIGKNTYDSISIGSINGHYYFIKGMINKIMENEPDMNIIFTGGNSEHIEKLINIDGFIINKKLIFQGLLNFIL